MLISRTSLRMAVAVGAITLTAAACGGDDGGSNTATTLIDTATVTVVDGSAADEGGSDGEAAAETTAPPTTIEEADLGVFEMAVGDCFGDPDSDEGVSEVAQVDCANPHINEVFALFQLEGDVYPGDDAVSEQSEAGCVERFEPFVGSDYETSKWFAGNLYPSPETWDNIDDREVICYLFLSDGEAVGSARDSAE